MTALRHALAGLLACLLSAGAWAQSGYPHPLSMMGDKTGEDWHRACMAVAAAAPPPADLPDAAARKRLAGCDAEDMYYDTLSQAQPGPGAWRNVRHCAIVRGDDTVLMMLYANGFGVRRDLDLAINRACRLHTAPAEMSGRVTHLMSLREGEEEKPFDQCDDITSGVMGGVCERIAARQAQRVRERQLRRLTAAWTAEDKRALDALRTAM